MNIHFIQHETFETAGAYLDWAEKRKYNISFSKVFEGDKLPDSAENIDMLIILGGPQDPATSTEECPHFDAKAEINLIKKCIDVGKAVVGICLGSQLIGESLGFKFGHSPEKEIGNFAIELTEQGLQDEKISHFGKTLVVGHWHNDMPGLENDNQILAFSKGCPRQIVKYSNIVYGFQCHMELTKEVVKELINSEKDLLNLSKTHPIDEKLIQNIPVHQSPKNYFYRNKMEYSLYYNHDIKKIQLAVHYRGSHRKMPITSSSLELPAIFARANQIVDELNRTKQEARSFQSLLLRANQSGEVSGGLLENGKPHPVFPNLTDTLLDNTYSYSPGGFFQINLPVYEAALLQIKAFLEDSISVLDLYAGVGTIGLSVARDKVLTLVEVNKSAYEELAANSTRVAHTTNNQLIRPILAKSEEVLDQISADTSVILDPPRAGCDQKLIQKLCEVQPQKIVYLSCNPVTQARDLSSLLQYYNIHSIQGFNFFPHTPHIESLVLLTLK